MSDYFVSDEFLEVLQNGDAYDDSLNDDSLNFDGYEPALGDNQFLEDPSEQLYEPSPIDTKEPAKKEKGKETLSGREVELPTGVEGHLRSNEALPSHDEPQSGPSNGNNQIYSEPTTSVEKGNARESPVNSPVGHSSNCCPQPSHEPTGDALPNHDSNDFAEDRGDASSLPKPIPQHDSSSSNQQQDITSGESKKRQLDANVFEQSHKKYKSNKYTTEPTDESSNLNQPQIDRSGTDYSTQLESDGLVAEDPSSNFQSENNLLGSQQPTEFDFDFDSEEWKSAIRRVDNRDLAEILGFEISEDQPTSEVPEEGKGKWKEREESGPSPLSEHGRPSTGGLSRGGNVGNSSNSTQPHISSREDHTATVSGQDEAATNAASLHGPDEAVAEQNASDDLQINVYDEDDSSIDEDPQQDGWGRTGKMNGQDVWFDPKTGQWQQSATHHDMRATLIARAQAEYPNDRYLHPDPTGGIPHGETAFFKPHQNRGPSRDQCADELFVWRDYVPKRDENGKLLRRSKPKNKMRHPGFMYEGDKILLDPHNNPVVDHKFIPLTLSIYTDGSKLQEMTLHPECRQVDLWARMPRWERKRNKNGGYDRVPLKDRNTRVNMPMSRFRERKGTIAGGDREGTPEIMAGLLRFYRSNGFDPVAAGNSVKAFPRDLEPWEIKEVRLGNAARFGVRAGRRALDDDKRQEKHQKRLKSIENGKNKKAARNEDDSKKRPREEEEEEEAEGSHSTALDPQKRRRGGQEVNLGPANWDERYVDIEQPSYPQGDQYGFGYPNNPNAYGNFQPSQYTNGGLPMANQYSYPGEQPMLVPNQSNFYQSSTSYTPVQNNFFQSPYGGAQMQAATNLSGHRSTPFLVNSPMVNNSSYSGYQYPQSNVDIATFGDLGPNTLAPGGCRAQKAPNQTLGKRRHEATIEYEDVEDIIPWTQQDEAIAQAQLHPEMNSPYKRQRYNEPPRTEPRPPRRSQMRRMPQAQYYGTLGAPQPLFVPDGFFESMPPTANAYANTSLMTPEELVQGPGCVVGEIDPNEYSTGIVGQNLTLAPQYQSAYLPQDVGLPPLQQQVNGTFSYIDQPPQYDETDWTPIQPVNTNANVFDLDEFPILNDEPGAE